MLKLQKQEHRLYAAIGTSPAVVFGTHELLEGHATSHPSQVRYMDEHYVDQEVVVANRCVTSQGPGTAIQFSLKLVALLCGEHEAFRVAEQLLYPMP
jgi:protein deglycase